MDPKLDIKDIEIILNWFSKTKYGNYSQSTAGNES